MMYKLKKKRFFLFLLLHRTVLRVRKFPVIMAYYRPGVLRLRAPSKVVTRFYCCAAVDCCSCCDQSSSTENLHTLLLACLGSTARSREREFLSFESKWPPPSSSIAIYYASYFLKEGKSYCIGAS